VKQYDVWENINHFYTEKWQQHSGFWREHYSPALLVYAVSLYERRNSTILSYVSDGLNTVLDIGCGVGDLMQMLTEKAQLVCGVDIAWVNVLQAQKNLKRSGITNAVTIQAPAEWLPFSAGELDLVVMADVIEHVLDIGVVLQEIKRVLRPGGLFICITPRKGFLNGLEKIDSAVQAMLLWLLKRQKNVARSPIFERFLSKQEVATALQRAGFVVQYYRPTCFYPGPEAGGLFALLLTFLYTTLSVKHFSRFSRQTIRLFDGIERLQVFNQKQMWIARS
jgi:ubiquinone/menaquinone biosynthesis C-methylase UbiE